MLKPSDQKKSSPPVENDNKADLLNQLTPREREVLSLLAQGYSNLRIAESLHISRHTVKNHVSNIYRKLKMDDRTQIAILAIRHGFGTIDY